jgi:hypothetical protein
LLIAQPITLLPTLLPIISLLGMVLTNHMNNPEVPSRLPTISTQDTIISIPHMLPVLLKVKISIPFSAIILSAENINLLLGPPGQAEISVPVELITTTTISR